MRIKSSSTMLIALAAAACAQSPVSIAPSYVSYLQYKNLSCDQLEQEVARLDIALADASKLQSDARDGDTVGILLIGLPMASIAGEDIAPHIATYKGQENALHESIIRKKCVAAPSQWPEAQRSN